MLWYKFSARKQLNLPFDQGSGWDYLSLEQQRQVKEGFDGDGVIKTRMPISALSFHSKSIEKARRDIEEGRPSSTDGPVEVIYDSDKDSFLLTDGYHRLVSAIDNGESEIDVTIRRSGYNPDYQVPLTTQAIYKTKTSSIGRNFHETYERLAPQYGTPKELSYGFQWEEESTEYHGLMSRIFDELIGKEFDEMGPSERAQSFHSLFEKYGPKVSSEEELMLGKTFEEEPTAYQSLLTKVFEEITL